MKSLFPQEKQRDGQFTGFVSPPHVKEELILPSEKLNTVSRRGAKLCNYNQGRKGSVHLLVKSEELPETALVLDY